MKIRQTKKIARKHRVGGDSSYSHRQLEIVLRTMLRHKRRSVRQCLKSSYLYFPITVKDIVPDGCITISDYVLIEAARKHADRLGKHLEKKYLESRLFNESGASTSQMPCNEQQAKDAIRHILKECHDKQLQKTRDTYSEFCSRLGITPPELRRIDEFPQDRA